MSRRHASTIAFIIGASLLKPSTAVADDLLKEIVKGNDATLDAIYSFSCRFAGFGTGMEGKPLPPFPQGEYLRSVDSYRITTGQAAGTSTIIRSQGKILGIVDAKHGSKPGKHCTIDNDSSQIDSRIDVYYRALFTFVVKDEPRLFRFSELLKHPDFKVRGSRRLSEGGRSFVVVDMLQLSTSSTREFWFEPSKGYLVYKMKGTSNQNTGKASVGEALVMRFVEPSPGHFFPQETEFSYWSNDTQEGRETFRFSEIKINQPLPASAFTLTLPVGTRVHDLIDQKAYVVGAGGSRLNAKDISNLVPPPGLSQERKNGDSGSIKETQVEPQSWTRAILPISVIVLLLAATLSVIRHLRKSKKD